MKTTTMTKELFFKQVKLNVEAIMKDCNIELRKVVKPGNVTLTGILIRSEKQNVIPTIYLDDYFKMYTSITMDEIVNLVISDWKKYSENSELDVFSKLDDKNNIYLRVLNKNLSSEYLKDTFYKEIINTNLVLVPYIKFNNFKEASAITKITNNLLDFLNLNQEDVFEIAFANCKKNMKPIVNDMEDILLNELMGSGIAENKIPNLPTMALISNQKKINGATVIFYSDILKQVADTWNTNLIIIPSSTHEVIVIPYDMFSYEEVKSMIVEVNEKCVHNEEILDNIPYVFKRDTDSIEMF